MPQLTKEHPASRVLAVRDIRPAASYHDPVPNIVQSWHQLISGIMAQIHQESAN